MNITRLQRPSLQLHDTNVTTSHQTSQQLHAADVAISQHVVQPCPLPGAGMMSLVLLKKTALASYQGSGNTWLRYLLTTASGECMDIIYIHTYVTHAQTHTHTHKHTHTHTHYMHTHTHIHRAIKRTAFASYQGSGNTWLRYLLTTGSCKCVKSHIHIYTHTHTHKHTPTLHAHTHTHTHQ